VPTLGNNDSDCGNYAITPQGPFLKMFAAAWAPLIGQGGDQDAFQAMFSRGGYFSLKLPHVKDHRVIILNSVFFSVSYANACGTGDNRKPSMDELDWLATTLAQARAARETVWLVMHIPPGINSFATARSVQKNGPAVTLWQPEWTDRFLQLVERYQGTIQATLGGHMHMDDFRVIRLHGKPVLFCKLAPAISPIYGNNPGYQIGQYDRQTGAIANYQTYFLANLAKDGVPRESVAGSWELEYDFGATYGSSGLNSQSIARIADDLRTKAMVQRDYIRFYSVSAAPEMTAQTIDIYRCAILSTTAQEFEACYRGGAEPHR
jgi:sphingomyelin phosphodiesterase acid-like 3